MSSLSHDAKVRLTTLLAQFCGPAEAAKIVSAEFGVTLDRRTAWKFDASKRGCTAGPRYRQLFREVRERWLNDIAAIPIAQQGHRLRVLDRLVVKLEARGDYGGALKALEQAQKEVARYGQSAPQFSAAAPATKLEARAELAARLAAFVDQQGDHSGPA